MKIEIDKSKVIFLETEGRIFEVERIKMENLEEFMVPGKSKKSPYHAFYESLDPEYKQAISLKEFHRGVQLYYATLKTSEANFDILPFPIMLIYGDLEDNLGYYFSKNALEYYGLFFNSYYNVGSKVIKSLMKTVLSFVNVWGEVFNKKEDISTLELMETSNYINFKVVKLVVKEELEEYSKLHGDNVHHNYSVPSCGSNHSSVSHHNQGFNFGHGNHHHNGRCDSSECDFSRSSGCDFSKSSGCDDSYPTLEAIDVKEEEIKKGKLHYAFTEVSGCRRKNGHVLTVETDLTSEIDSIQEIPCDEC